MREFNNGISPVTFGDCYLDENGVQQPFDKELIKEHDYCTQQTLDYIFQIKRAFNVESDKFLIESGQGSAETTDNRRIENTKRLELDIQQSRVDKFFFDTHHAVK